MKIKTIFTFVLCVSLAMMFLSFESSALKINGFLTENEWKNTQPTVLITDSDAANCGIEKGILSIFCDESTEKIYLGYKVSLTDAVDDKNISYGASFSLDSGNFIKITRNGISSYDSDKYSVEAQITAYSDTVFCVEAVVGVKYGLDSVDTVRVRFIDADGAPSNVYTVEIPTDSAEEAETAQPIISNSASDNEVKTTKIKDTVSATKNPKTTKSKTAVTSDGIYINDAVTTNLDTKLSMQEETTVMTVKQFKMQKGFTYAAVAGLILLSLGICVAVNLARDKEKSKK